MINYNHILYRKNHFSSYLINIILYQNIDKFNITHRSKWVEVTQRNIIAVTTLSVQNNTEDDIFKEYTNYFIRKDRVYIFLLLIE